MKNKNYTTTILVNQSPSEAFNNILNVRGWWSGLYAEEIKGASKNVGDEFSFRAGGGAHYSKQKLVELVPNKRVVWLVTDSELSFIENKGEWNGSKIIFDFEPKGEKTEIRFTHDGLTPEIECYGSCSSAWGEYMARMDAVV